MEVAAARMPVSGRRTMLPLPSTGSPMTGTMSIRLSPVSRTSWMGPQLSMSTMTVQKKRLRIVVVQVGRKFLLVISQRKQEERGSSENRKVKFTSRMQKRRRREESPARKMVKSLRKNLMTVCLTSFLQLIMTIPP